MSLLYKVAARTAPGMEPTWGDELSSPGEESNSEAAPTIHHRGQKVIRVPTNTLYGLGCKSPFGHGAKRLLGWRPEASLFTR